MSYIEFKCRNSLLRENNFKYIGLLLLPELSSLVESYSREYPWLEELLNVYSKRTIIYNYNQPNPYLASCGSYLYWYINKYSTLSGYIKDNGPYSERRSEYNRTTTYTWKRSKRLIR